MASGTPRHFLSASVSPRLVLRVLLVAIFLSTSIGLWYATTHRAQIVAAFPGAKEPRVFVALVATGAVGLVAVSGLWLWRRWAIVLYGCMAAASIGLDVVARAPRAHQATAIVAAVAVSWLVYLNRSCFE